MTPEKNIDDRKTFVSCYGKKDTEWFRKVFWSDESRFSLFSDALKCCKAKWSLMQQK